MNLLLINREEVSASGHVVLSDRRAHHLKCVVGVRVGQSLKAGIVRGSFAEARVLGVEGAIELELKLGATPPTPGVDLVLAVPRPKALPRIIQAAASFGVRRLDIVNAWKVDASYFSSPKLTLESLREEALLGCEQGRQTWVPEIDVHRYFVSFAENVLGPRLRTELGRRLLVAHPGATGAIECALAPGDPTPLVVAIGPDGGFIEREIASLSELGGTAVHFGPAVLRSEVAVVAILSQLDLLRRLPSRDTSANPVALQAPMGSSEPSPNETDITCHARSDRFSRI